MYQILEKDVFSIPGRGLGCFIGLKVEVYGPRRWSGLPYNGCFILVALILSIPISIRIQMVSTILLPVATSVSLGQVFAGNLINIADKSLLSTFWANMLFASFL